MPRVAAVIRAGQGGARQSRQGWGRDVTRLLEQMVFRTGLVVLGLLITIVYLLYPRRVHCARPTSRVI
jgi:hypothetical protein